MAMAKNVGDSRERRWRAEILSSESSDDREPAFVFCDVSAEWRAKWRAERGESREQREKKNQAKKKKNLNRGVRNIF
jgi:hypothetical protein